MAKIKLIVWGVFFILFSICCPRIEAVSGGGVPPPGSMNSVSPTEGGNAGKVTVSILGKFPHDPCKVILFSLQGTQIEGSVLKISRATYYSPEGIPLDIITVVFDLTDKPTGLYNLAVTSPDNCVQFETVLYNSFTIKAGTLPVLWVSIGGITPVRFGANITYQIFYGNRGNNDIESAVLFIGIPKGNGPGDPTHTLGFNLSDYRLDSYDPQNPAWQGDPYQQQLDVNIDNKNYVIYKLFVKNIPPFSLNPLKMNIQWGNNLNDYLLKAWWAESKPAEYHPAWPQ